VIICDLTGLAGGGAPEIEVSRQLGAWAKTLQGMDSFCIRAFADALEVKTPFVVLIAVSFQFMMLDMLSGFC
jgi:chaperonin GroEL (HSP60 family)